MVPREVKVHSSPLQRMTKTHSLKVGDQVRSRADTARVGMIRKLGPVHAEIPYYVVFWGGVSGSATVSESDLVPEGLELSPAEALAGARGGYAEFQRLLTMQRLGRENPLRNNIYAFNASKIQFYPYQFKPLLKFLESSRHRLLICDEVGLGKTIEAGLILLELRARQTLRTVLVLCPSNLRDKWRRELRTRFGEEFRILSVSDIMQFLDEYEEDPYRATVNGIVSTETMRSERIRERLGRTTASLDLVIVDEAHHLRNSNTAIHEVAKTLSGWAQAMVMLTATPVHLRQENLFSLLNILDEEDFRDLDTTLERFENNGHIVLAQSALTRLPIDLATVAEHLGRASMTEWFQRNQALDGVRSRIHQLLNNQASTTTSADIAVLQRDLAGLNLLGHILTRTRKRDVHVKAPVRRPTAIEITLTPRERELYDRVTDWVRQQALEAGGFDRNLGWRLNTPQRRLSSSFQGMVEFYRGESQQVQGDDPEGFELDEPETSKAEGIPIVKLSPAIRDIIRSWPSDEPDSKYDQLRKVLLSLGPEGRVQKLLVFASFKSTIRYLERRLRADGVGVVSISGDTDGKARTKIIEGFEKDAETEVLLSTRVGAEGLDFQFCSAMVNYDLPWNPMEVEQRIGRLDRIGQPADSILIVNLWSLGTIEERILRRLYDRIGIFEHSIGDMEPILGETAPAIEQELLRASLSEAEEESMSKRVVQVLENKRQELAHLEATAARFVGADAFFDDEIDAIRNRRRYVTSEQLFHYVREFLRIESPQTRMEYDSRVGAGHLYPDDALRTFLQRRNRVSDALRIVGAVGGSVRITFDAQVAFEHPDWEFISVLHPLVSAITEHYEDQPGTRKGFQVAVRSEVVAPGLYFMFVYRLTVTAARSFNSLEAVFLTENMQEATDAVGAETLLGEIVERGSNIIDSVEVDMQIAEAAVECADQVFLSRKETLVVAEQSVNDAFVEQRMTSLSSFFGKNVGKLRQRLERAQADNAQEKYQRMVRGQLANELAKLAHETEQLEQRRRVAAEHSELAIGIVEVLPVI